MVPGVAVDDDTINIKGNNVILTLSWREPFNNLDPIVNYTVSCSGDDRCPPNFTTDNTTRSYTITNLTPMTNYKFLVVATNSIGSGEAGVVRITTPPGDIITTASNDQGMTTTSSVGTTTTASSVGMTTTTPSVGMTTATSSVGMTTATPSVGMTTSTSSVGMTTATSSVGVTTSTSSVGMAITIHISSIGNYTIPHECTT